MCFVPVSISVSRGDGRFPPIVRITKGHAAYVRGVLTVLHDTALTPHRMRAGLVRRLHAKSMKYRRPSVDPGINLSAGRYYLHPV
jgi:hypothetical protein